MGQPDDILENADKPKQSLGQQAVKGAFWTYTQQFGTLGIQFIVTTILARLLEPSEFGLIGMITIFIQIANIMVQGGMTQSLIRSKKVDNKDLATVFFFNLGVSVLLYGALFICSPFIAKFYEQDILMDILKVYGLIFVINAFGVVQITMLTRNLNFRKQTMISIVSLIGGASLGIFLAYSNYGVWSLVYSQITTAVIATLLYWITSAWKPSLFFDKPTFKKHFNFGYKLTLSGLLNVTFQNIYLIVIGKLFNPTQLGYYTQSVKLRNLPVSTFSNSLQKVTFPLFSKCANDAELKTLFQKVCITVIYIIAPILFALSVLAPEVTAVILSEKWLPAAPYLSLLCFAGVLLPIHAFNLNILLVKGRSDLFFKLDLFKKGLIVLVIFFSINFGIKGLIIGQLINSLIGLPINAYYINRFLHYKLLNQMRDLTPPIILSGLVALLVYYLKQFFFTESPVLLSLLIWGILFAFSYLLLSFLFRLNGLLFVREIIHKFKNK